VLSVFYFLLVYGVSAEVKEKNIVPQSRHEAPLSPSFVVTKSEPTWIRNMEVCYLPLVLQVSKVMDYIGLWLENHRIDLNAIENVK
jgi:hypothetical protein